METIFRGRRPAVPPETMVAALDAIERRFEVRLRTAAVEDRLDRAEQRRLVALTHGAPLEEKEARELVGLVEKVAPRLLERKAEAEAEQERQVAARVDAAQREPVQLLMGPGDAVLPAAVIEDVLAEQLEPLDLAVLSLLALTFSTGRVQRGPARRGVVRWGDDGALVVKGNGSALLDEWEPSARGPADHAVTPRFERILGRLEAGRWLAVERSPGEVRVRPGDRLIPEGERP